MTVDIENGQDIIDILSDGFVTCLKVRRPIALDWYDCAGSAGKYFACTTDYEPISKEFNEVLISGNDEDVLSAIFNFLKFFNSGQYSILIDRNQRPDLELHTEYGHLETSNNFYYGYYNPSGKNLMFTQSIKNINNETVRYYEKLILSGLRPKAVVFQSFFNDYGTYEDGSKWMSSLDSPMFILDGHHKLLAYRNLNVDPQFVLILKERIGKEEFPKNKNSLYFEFEYFLTDQSKQHIISHTTQLLIDKIDYNQQFDRYLYSTRRIEIEVLELFKIASLSNDKNKIEWLLDRLRILESKNFEIDNMFLNYHQITAEYPKGIWDGMEIKSKSDFDTWIIRIFGKTIDELKKNIT